MKLKPDPLGIPRDPLAIYLLCIAAFSGVSNLLGFTTSGSIDSELPPFARHMWGAMLLLGSGSVLAGMFWQGDRRTGLVVKRFGFASLFFASLIWTVVLIMSAWNAATVAGLTVGFAAACAYRWHQVNRAIGAIVEKS